jgi:PAS domain S-box-containing protein
MPDSLRVLIVEDSIDDTLFIVHELLRGGFEVTSERVEAASAMETALTSHSWDVIISDYSIPGFGGLGALAIYQRKGLDCPFIMVSGVMGEELAVEMIKAGAHYYMTKAHLDRLGAVVRQELHAARERQIRKQTEATALYLSSLVESCDDAIIGQSLDGKVVSWNPGAERLYGYSAQDMAGRSISVLIPKYRPDELPEILEKIRSGAQVDRFETIRLRKDGTVVEVSETLSPVKAADGSIIGASCVARDITRRKQEDNERLALIQELTAALSHLEGSRIEPARKS